MKVALLLGIAVLSGPLLAADVQDITDSLIDAEHSRVWNRFAEQVVALHRQQLAGREVRVEERTGHYGGEMAKRYRFREASYYEAGTGRLLSRVRTDRDRPDEVQIAEVYVYGDDGRLARDYAFVYLPWGRGAPVRTFVSLHDHRNGLHAFRQFDASGRPIYERCDGTEAGRALKISLPEERIGGPAGDTADYQRCFVGLPQTAGVWLTPQ